MDKRKYQYTKLEIVDKTHMFDLPSFSNWLGFTTQPYKNHYRLATISEVCDNLDQVMDFSSNNFRRNADLNYGIDGGKLIKGPQIPWCIA